MAGGAGITVGVVAHPGERPEFERRFSRHWQPIDLWHPGRLLALGCRCDVLIFAPRLKGPEQEERRAALTTTVLEPAIPLVLYGRLERPGLIVDIASHWNIVDIALRPHDRSSLPDFVLDAYFRRLLRKVAAAIRTRQGADPVLLSMLADLVDRSVMPLRQAGECRATGQVPFPRHVTELLNRKRTGRAWLRDACREAGIDVVRFLGLNTALQIAVRYVPGRGHQLGVRLGFASADALRMTSVRKLNVGLSLLHTVQVWPLVERLLETVYA